MFSDAGGFLLKIEPCLRHLTTFLFVILGPWMIKLGGTWDLPENLEKTWSYGLNVKCSLIWECYFGRLWNILRVLGWL